MKKLLWLFLAVIVLGCSKEETPAPEEIKTDEPELIKVSYRVVCFDCSNRDISVQYMDSEEKIQSLVVKKDFNLSFLSLEGNNLYLSASLPNDNKFLWTMISYEYFDVGLLIDEDKAEPYIANKIVFSSGKVPDRN